MADTLAWKIPWTEEPCRLISMGLQSQTGLSDFLFTFYFHALEKGMVTHSSVLVWRIPVMREPGGLPFCEVTQNRTQLKWLSSRSSICEKLGFPCGSAGKECTCNAGDLVSIPEWGGSPGEGKSYSLQYSGLKNSMGCIIYGVAKSRTWLSDFHYHYYTWKSRKMQPLLKTVSSSFIIYIYYWRVIALQNFVISLKP